jgi:hypothetical protein
MAISATLTRKRRDKFKNVMLDFEKGRLTHMVGVGKAKVSKRVMKKGVAKQIATAESEKIK